MGWTSLYPTEYANGRVDKKAQMTKELSRFSDCRIIKCAMVGSVYYAAYEMTKRPNEVHALVCLTEMHDGWFYYKDMEEEMGPYECKCPKAILDLLTPTSNEYARKWREACLANIGKPSAYERLKKLPYGTIIESNGQQFVKEAPAYQFKKFWMRYLGRFNYISIKNISENFTIVKMGEAA